ncbi:hypothetical protein [Nostoc sp.]|uniref:hypothetical protein n=1 Tax=Nostoc sp. TaxID=1180 RepID=UPI002FF83517
MPNSHCPIPNLALRIVHFASVPMVILFAVIHYQLGQKAGGTQLIEQCLSKPTTDSYGNAGINDQ